MSDGDEVIGPTGDARRSLNSFREHVYSNWRSGEHGTCASCTAHSLDRGGHPEFGALNPDAEIMWVNNTPGYSGGDEVPENRPRPYDEPPEKHPTPVEDIPESIDGMYSTEAIGDHHMYSYKLDTDWPVGGGYSFWPLHTVLKEPNGVELDASMDDFYYTNSLKCAKYGNWDIDHDARVSCGSYLRYEIEDFVQPSIIVTGGAEATVTVLAALGVQLDVSESESKCSIHRGGERYSVPGIARLVGNCSNDDLFGQEDAYGDPRSGEFLHAGYGTGPVVIPTYQFDNCFRNWNLAPWNPEKNEDYFEHLVRRINVELGP